MSLHVHCFTGTENNFPKWKNFYGEKKGSNITAAPDLGHLILVGEFGCQGNRASSKAEALKYIFDEIIQNGGERR